MNASTPQPPPEVGTVFGERPRITAILNCFAPNGANRGQVVIRADGSTEVYGESDRSLIKPALCALKSIDMRKFRGVR